MARGIAINTASAQQFLDRCEAVTTWRERDADTIDFDFDPAVELPIVPPGVFFDSTAKINLDEQCAECLECDYVAPVKDFVAAAVSPDEAGRCPMCGSLEVCPDIELL